MPTDFKRVVVPATSSDSGSPVADPADQVAKCVHDRHNDRQTGRARFRDIELLQDRTAHDGEETAGEPECPCLKLDGPLQFVRLAHVAECGADYECGGYPGNSSDHPPESGRRYEPPVEEREAADEENHPQEAGANEHQLVVLVRCGAGLRAVV